MPSFGPGHCLRHDSWEYHERWMPRLVSSPEMEKSLPGSVGQVAVEPWRTEGGPGCH